MVTVSQIKGTAPVIHTGDPTYDGMGRTSIQAG